ESGFPLQLDNPFRAAGKAEHPLPVHLQHKKVPSGADRAERPDAQAGGGPLDAPQTSSRIHRFTLPRLADSTPFLSPMLFPKKAAFIFRPPADDGRTDQTDCRSASCGW